MIKPNKNLGHIFGDIGMKSDELNFYNSIIDTYSKYAASDVDQEELSKYSEILNQLKAMLKSTSVDTIVHDTANLQAELARLSSEHVRMKKMLSDYMQIIQTKELEIKELNAKIPTFDFKSTRFEDMF